MSGQLVGELEKNALPASNLFEKEVVAELDNFWIPFDIFRFLVPPYQKDIHTGNE